MPALSSAARGAARLAATARPSMRHKNETCVTRAQASTKAPSLERRSKIRGVTTKTQPTPKRKKRMAPHSRCSLGRAGMAKRLQRPPTSMASVGARASITSPEGASRYVLRGTVNNPGRTSVVDTDVYARILDRSGEPVLQNRTRVGSIGDVDPGEQSFALRLAIPAGTPGPFEVKT